MKAISEDQEDWDLLQEDWDLLRKKNDLPLEWKLYSREYHFATCLHETKSYSGRHLKLGVRHAIEMEKLLELQAKEWKELEQLIQLESTYK